MAVKWVILDAMGVVYRVGDDVADLLVPYIRERQRNISSDLIQQAIELADGDDAVIVVLHVIDRELVDFAVEHGFGNEEEVTRRMRAHAEQQLRELRAPHPETSGVDAIISVGIPFVEIIAKAKDFDVDVIVMGKFGQKGGVEHLLFGSTAEKVLRATSRPVLVLPGGHST